MFHDTLQLSDDRTLSYTVYGPEEGKPVLYFHGTPSSRLEPVLADIYGLNLAGLLQQYSLKLIAVDRPGMGLSTFDEQRTFSSFACDAMALLQYLQIPKCAVLCWSGGGPYALTLAHQFPDVVSSVYIIAGISASFGRQEVFEQMGWNKVYFNTAKSAPLLLHGSLEVTKHINFSMPVSQSLYELSNADYALMKNVDQFNELMRVTLKEACCNSTDGAVQEAALYFQPYPYQLADIRVPVHFWWGTDDTIVTYVHAKELERNLPSVVPHYKAGEGHLSIYIHYFEEVLRTISSSVG